MVAYRRVYHFVSGFQIALLATALCVTTPAALAQSAQHAPGVVPTHAADLGGIWTNASPGVLRNDPPYNDEWAKRYQEIRRKVAAGEPFFDGSEHCLPPGMPRFLLWLYPVEILMTPDQVTLLSEYFNETRRIFTDGRSHPPEKELEQTFRGHSVGHWEGKTLVAETVGMNDKTVFSNSLAPHSDKLRVIEKVTLVKPNELRWNVTLDDPVAFKAPWNFSMRLVRADAADEIREYVCAESVPEGTRNYQKAN